MRFMARGCGKWFLGVGFVFLMWGAGIGVCADGMGDIYQNLPSCGKGEKTDCLCPDEAPGGCYTAMNTPCCRCPPCGSLAQPCPTTSSLRFKVGTGKGRPGSVLPNGLIDIQSETITDGLYTPQSMGYEMGYMITHVSEALTTNGVPRQVTVLGTPSKPVIYQFADNVSTGLPTGQYSASLDRLVMVNAAGQPVLNNPAYYDLVEGNGGRYRYGAATNLEQYCGLISYRTPYGRESLVDESGVKVIRDENNVIRQISVPQCLVDVVTLTDVKYEMRFYAHEHRGTWNGAEGLYQPTGEPLVTFRVEDPSLGQAHTNVLITEIAGTRIRTYNYLYTAASGLWELKTGDGLKEETKDAVWDESHVNRLETRIVKTGAGQEAARSTETFHVFPWGDSAVEQTTGLGDCLLTTTIAYYEDSAETGRYSHVKSQVNPDGAWMMYDYDVSGRKTMDVTPWKGASLGDTNSTRIVTYGYAPHVANDVGGVTCFSKARTVTEAVRTGTTTHTVAKTLYAFYADANGEKIEVEEKCVTPDADYGAANNLRSVRVFYATNATDAAKGQLKSETQPNGLMDSYTYEYGYYHATNATPAGYWFEPAADGDSLRVTVVHATTNQPNGVAYQTTRQTTINDAFNNKALEETYVCTGGPNYTRIAWTTYEYDSLGRPVKESRSDGTELDSTWTTCCGKESETLPDGTQKAYDYDNLNQLLAETRIGTNSADDVLTEYTYDAAGRRLTEVRSGGGLSLANRSAYDLAGRLTNSVDEAGIATRYEYGNGGLIRRAIRAGVTNVIENYLDGRAKSIADNGVIKTFYDYGVNADGSKWSKVYSGPAGSNSPVWTKTTTDILGRTIQEEKPGYGGTVIANIYVYNGKGQLVATQVSGFNPQPSATLYEYNELGEQTRSGIDLNNNGVLDLAGPDRVNASDTSYQSDASGDVWQVSASILYAGENSATPTTNGVQKTRLTGLGSSSGFGVLTSESCSLDILNHPTINRAFVDRDAKTVTQVINYPDSTTNAEQRTVNGRLVTSTSKTGVRTDYTYDTLGRQVRAATGGGSRSVATVTHYNALGRVDWTEDAASNRTTYAYDSATGRRITVTDALANATHTAYDAEGRVLATWGATYPVAYDYDSYGRMTAMYTYRGTTEITSYAQLANLQSQMDRTTWSYDPATSLLTNKLYADGKGPSYTYTADGKLASRIWARGVVTAYTYDGARQMTNINYSDNTPDVSFTFDRLGRQVAITDGQGMRAFAYNDALQLATETNSQGVLAYAYDPYGRRTGFDWGAGYNVRYGYDTVGRFSSVSSSVQSASSVVQYSRLAGSDLVAGWSNDTGFGVARTFEANRDLITQVLNMAGTNLISQFNYDNDAVGRRERRVDTSTMSIQSTNAFGYNARNELVDAAMGTNRYSYLYDPIGNRQAATNNTTITKYTANALNQYSQITNTQSPITIVPTYDDDGNMTSYNGWTFTWDAENRLVLASNGTTVVSNAYDYMSRRIVKAANGSSRTFLYDGWAMIREATTGETNNYVYGLDLSGTLQGAGTIGGLLTATRDQEKGLTHCCYAYDANGNVVDLMDDNGTAVGHYEYDPYGNTTAMSGALASANPFRFSAKYLDDETAMYYYGFRFFLPELGRWASRDPIGEEGFVRLYSGGKGPREIMRLRAASRYPSYLFVKNSPLALCDPLGLQYCYTWTDPMFGDTVTVCYPEANPDAGNCCSKAKCRQWCTIGATTMRAACATICLLAEEGWWICFKPCNSVVSAANAACFLGCTACAMP